MIRYSLAKPEIMPERFKAEMNEPISPRYNIEPYQLVPVVVNRRRTVVSVMRWGFLSSWAQDARDGLINARCETIADKPSFRAAFTARRCIVPATSYFAKPEAANPQKVWLRDQAMFAVAGVYAMWTGPGGRRFPTVAIITCPANRPLAQVQERMPCILDPREENYWLDPEASDAEHLLSLLKPYRPREIFVTRVTRLVNNPANDIPSVLAPYTDAESRHAFPDLS
jgi:putative SOS response-associated peptidase YedK